MRTRSRSGWALGLFALALAMPDLFGQPSSEPRPPGPRIEFLQQRQELGGVPRGELAVARFEFRNGGDELLRILRVDPG